MAMDRRPEVGDVIVCRRFAVGMRKSEHIDVGEHRFAVQEERIPEQERVQMARATGMEPPTHRTVDFRDDDPSRGRAKFVVIDARLTGGGRVHNDVIPDGWQVTAQRLRRDDSYDPAAETIRFFVPPWAGMSIPLSELTLVGRMERRVDFR